jgi:hypothetical protein
MGLIVGDEDAGRQFGVGGFRGDGLGGGAHENQRSAFSVQRSGRASAKKHSATEQNAHR